MGHQAHPTTVPKQLQNNEKETYNPDNIYELLGFVKSAANSDDFEYSNIELKVDIEYTGNE